LAGTIAIFIFKLMVGAAFIWFAYDGLKEPIVERRPLSFVGAEYGFRWLVYLLITGAVIIVLTISDVFR
jgi:hypothetical protein